jgi:hypothetical protein
MSYATSALAGPITQVAGPVSFRLWLLDTVDTTTDVDGAGFISDAKERGMYKGDIVIVRIWTSAIPAATSEMLTPDGTANDLTAVGLHFVIGMSTAGAADLTNVLAITATNSD